MRMCICSKILKEYDLEEAVRISSRLGYEGIELFGFERHLPVSIEMERVKALRRLCEDLGLRVVTLCTYVGGYSELGDEECEKQLSDFRRYVEVAGELGCRLIRQIPGGPAHPRDAREDHWLRCAHYLRRAADHGLAHGVAIVLENNFGLAATVDSTLRLIRLVDRPNVGVNYDPGNIYRLTPDHYGAEAVKRFRELILNVQVKDTDGKRIDMLLGEGRVDYASIIGALREIGYDGFLSAECHREPDERMNATQIAEHEYNAIKRLIEAKG